MFNILNPLETIGVSRWQIGLVGMGLRGQRKKRKNCASLYDCAQRSVNGLIHTAGSVNAKLHLLCNRSLIQSFFYLVDGVVVIYPDRVWPGS